MEREIRLAGISSFWLYWCARVGSTLAFQVLGVAIGWQVYALTGSALDLGLIGLAQALPTLTLFLAAGHAADRYDRRYVACACTGVEALTAAGIAASVLLHAVTAGLLFAAVVVVGICRAFEAPASASLLPNLVPRDRLQAATANSTSAFNVAQVVGPALGGVLYVLGPAVVYVCAAVLALAAASLVVLTRPVRQQLERGRPNARHLFAGATFVIRHPIVLGAFTLDFFAVILGGATALLPIYARDILATGPWGLGVLRSAPAVGALAMSLFLGYFPIKRRIGVALFATVAAYGCATVGFAIAHTLPLAFLALAGTGLFDVVSRVIRWTLVQLETPDDVRGRVTAVISMFTNSASQLGQFESGVVAAGFGAVASALSGGVGTIVIAALWAWLFPQIRRIDAMEGR